MGLRVAFVGLSLSIASVTTPLTSGMDPLNTTVVESQQQP